jgi:hypothetical protein
LDLAVVGVHLSIKTLEVFGVLLKETWSLPRNNQYNNPFNSILKGVEIGISLGLVLQVEARDQTLPMAQYTIRLPHLLPLLIMLPYLMVILK